MYVFLTTTGWGRRNLVSLMVSGMTLQVRKLLKFGHLKYCCNYAKIMKKVSVISNYKDKNWICVCTVLDIVTKEHVLWTVELKMAWPMPIGAEGNR